MAMSSEAQASGAGYIRRAAVAQVQTQMIRLLGHNPSNGLL